MCGIIGYVGEQPATPVVLSGLSQLEYRGYDSAGLAVMNGEQDIQIRRTSGKLANLIALVDQEPTHGSIGIGHTRWATHGNPCERNAHPHCSPDGHFAIVHNGIVENYLGLRDQMASEGYHPVSDTDTEVIVHLIHHFYHNGCGGNLEDAVRKTMNSLTGSSAVVVLSTDYPDRLIAARLGNAGGVVVGSGNDATFVASDMTALLPHTRQINYLDDGQMAVVQQNSVRFIQTADGSTIRKTPTHIDLNPASIHKGEYRHFMQKEIFQQGHSLANTLSDRLDLDRNQVTLESLNLSAARAHAIHRVIIVACGTSYYAGLIGKHYIERLAQIPVDVDYASEFRYRSPVIMPNDLVIAISQSGETADTLAALEEAKRCGAFTTAIVNAEGSEASRMCDGVVYMRVEPEIGVASTKAFTASVTDLLLFALYLGQLRGVLGDEQRKEIVSQLITLPRQVADLLADAWQSDRYRDMAQRYHRYGNFLYIGRGLNYPVAREGALKLKEISYIHAEGYPAGEMKHGPIALIDQNMPTVVLAPRDQIYSKMVNQIEQIKARDGAVLAVATQGDRYVESQADCVMPVPPTHNLLYPIIAVIPLQLFAYEMALCRGTNVDQPRNLAKSVTVE